MAAAPRAAMIHSISGATTAAPKAPPAQTDVGPDANVCGRPLELPGANSEPRPEMDNDYLELTISTVALPKVSLFFSLHYNESHLNRHCAVWQNSRMIQLASDPVMVLAHVPDLAARQKLVGQINDAHRVWVASSGVQKRRTLIRGNQTISGDDLARALVATGISNVVIVRYGAEVSA